MGQPKNRLTESYALRLASLKRCALLRFAAMDPFNSEQLNSEQWARTKVGALLCFALACALFAASLLTPESAQVASQGRLTTGSVSHGH